MSRRLLTYAIIGTSILLLLAGLLHLAAWLHSGRDVRLVYSYDMFRAEILQDVDPERHKGGSDWSNVYEAAAKRHLQIRNALTWLPKLDLALALLLLLLLTTHHLLDPESKDSRKPTPRKKKPDKAPNPIKKLLRYLLQD